VTIAPHKAEGIPADLFGVGDGYLTGFYRACHHLERVNGRSGTSLPTDRAWALFPQEVEAAIKQLVDKVDIGQIVANRVEQFEFDRLENLVYRVASTELNWVVYLGGVLGFIIGLLQVFFIWLIS